MKRNISVSISYFLDKYFDFFHKVLVESTLTYLFANDDEYSGWWNEIKEDLEDYDYWCEINPSLISNLKIEIIDIKMGKVCIVFDFLCNDTNTFKKFKEALEHNNDFDIDWVVKENLKDDLDHYFINDQINESDYSELKDICEDCNFKWDVEIN